MEVSQGGLLSATETAEVVPFLLAIQEHWLTSFLLNLVGYAFIILPAAYFIRKWKTDPAVQAGQGPLNYFLKMLVFGDETTESPISLAEKGEGGKVGTGSPLPESDGTTAVRYYSKLLLCIAGLQSTYLTWGILQERIMTRQYDGETFTNSQFLVFVNRVLALTISGLYLRVFPQSRHRAPFYKYSYSSISNTLSSWCQYEALKFVSFPTQVLAKAAKVIPVMLMGKIVSNRTYPWHEYVTAGILSMGVAVFLLAADPASAHHHHHHNHEAETTVAGVVILLGYMAFDSFTSNWQSELFRTYKLTSIQMMFGVNLFSCVLTAGSLLFRGALFSSLAFLASHSDFSFHTLLMSVCSAAGQLFIFHTIAEFGPIVFTLIMTTRQALSIILSCIVYQHPLSPQALVGVFVVFVALFLRAYFKSKKK